MLGDKHNDGVKATIDRHLGFDRDSLTLPSIIAVAVRKLISDISGVLRRLLEFGDGAFANTLDQISR